MPFQSGVGIDASQPLYSLYQSYRDQLSSAEDKAAAQKSDCSSIRWANLSVEATAATYHCPIVLAPNKPMLAIYPSQLASLKAQYLVR